MENNTDQPQSQFARLNQVTTASKYFALALFIILPFLGGYVGYHHALSSMAVSSFVLNDQSVLSVKNNNLPVKDTVFEDTTDFYYIKTVYPNDPKDTLKVIEQYVKGLVAEKQEEWKMGGEAQRAEAALTIELPDRPKVIYALDVRYSSSTHTKLNTVSYVLRISEMTGGANGNVAITTFTFGNDGVVAIDSILDFSNNKDIALSKLLAVVAVIQNPEAFQDVKQLKEGLGIAYLKSDGVTFDAEACGCDGFFFGSNFQNFSVTETGLTFTFSKFAIAAGAVMTPDISLTWAQLAPFLTKDFAKTL